MVQLISRPEYRIDHLPGYEDLVFSESSSEYLALPQSVTFAKERDSVLQSAREAWTFRIDSNGTLDSDRYQSTRTAALGVKVGNQYCVAFCDSNKPDENILLARPKEGYDLHATGKPWLVSNEDPVVKLMLERAQDEHRVVPALESTLELSTSRRDGASSYGTHPVTQAILGSDLTEHVASYLRAHGHGNGYVWTLSPNTLRDLGVDDNRVEVRRVGVGGNDYDDINNLYADGQCNDDGRARGVRESSTGNKGGC
jgi:hypothetical protein